ncbi:ribonuclease Oy-like [Mercenaria mercenaria]|uniref:ribonuclease Oy-like n=1 Tax=Mercenaria mercenaria TaxID=6596 RepID=UPI00234F6035|nr:ribonuclease Oy-like [Mercenaria mercenaria]XP_045193822.2 ribonuclease Oy-like [Mercenaria mercenaria]XP_045193823.2 ribonuclease Oy-like [Mercenaria mercenaria]XP_053401120.1 ribonuclease Oy-like [Mercenaria mercenaria]
MFPMKSEILGGVVLACMFLLPFQLVTCYEAKWDHFLFAQAWPPGICADAAKEKHVCHIGTQVKTWTIHGLWPQLGADKGPTSCNSSWHFDFSRIASLTQQLKAYWPNLYNDTIPDSFWEHEWDKHGTCCTDLDSTAGERNYFTTGLNLNKKYDVSQMLADSGVKPSETALYSYGDFVNAVKKAIGYEPVIQCTTRKQKNGSEYHLIDQVQICLNKDFTPRSCPDGTIYPSGYFHTKESSTTSNFVKGEINDLTGRRSSHHHYHGSQSCPDKFNYPPIHQV